MFHRIKPGETLQTLAASYGVSIAAIVNSNPFLSSQVHLVVGEHLYIPMERRFLRPVFGGGFRPVQGRQANYAQSYSDVFTRAFHLAIQSGLTGKSAPVDKHHGARWMKTAIGEIGVAEVNGSTSANPRILEYFKASKFWGDDDSGAKNAWCGSFAAWVMKENGYEPVSKAFRAKEWKSFGKKVSDPVYGALGIKSRKGGGHVSFVMGRNKLGTKLFMLGGNQDDKVQVSAYPRDVWDAFVVPTDFDNAKSRLPVHTSAADACGKES